MSLIPIPIIQRPVRERFPNRYTGGYDCSTVTDKLRWQTIQSVKNARLTMNSNMGGETVVGRKVYPCYCPPVIPVPNPCDSSVAAAFQSVNAVPFYSCSDPSGRCVVVGSWSVDPVIIKDGLGASVGFLSGIGSGSSGFVSVFDASGSCNWSAKVVGTSVVIKLVAADSSGNINCVGIAANGPITAYSSSGLQTLSPANVGVNNIFVVQYGPDGSLNWIANVLTTDAGSYNFFQEISLSVRIGPCICVLQRVRLHFDSTIAIILREDRLWHQEPNMVRCWGYLPSDFICGIRILCLWGQSHVP
jgi:hypothetical protein